MNYAVFWGCKIPFYLPQYELSVRAVLNVLGIKLTDMEFNCCGYPIRHDSFEASVFSGARNIALALKNNNQEIRRSAIRVLSAIRAT